jgi:hypothetical protein
MAQAWQPGDPQCWRTQCTMDKTLDMKHQVSSLYNPQEKIGLKKLPIPLHSTVTILLKAIDWLRLL